MNYFDQIMKIATGIGSVGVFIGVFLAYKSGLLSFIWNLKKTNGNGHDKAILERFDLLENNHLHAVESAIEGLRRDLSEHANVELQLLTKIATLLEQHGK